MKFVDATLARRLEASEDEAQLAIAAVLQLSQPEVGAEVFTIADGHAVFAGKDSPVGRTIGFGFAAPVLPADLDAIEAFYASKGAPAQIDVTPLQHESLTTLLHERGYSMSELNNVMAREIRPNERWEEEAKDIEFRACSPDQAELWTNTMLRGFFPDGDIPPGWDKLLMPMAQLSHGMPTIAWADGEPVAAFGGLICREWKLLMLGGTSTLPEYRGRGIQTAAIGHRLAIGFREGCDLAVVVTRGGTTSQRNAERMGFTLAYSKATLVQRK
jgi:GNAT superfamily N-acetyltransferase